MSRSKTVVLAMFCWAIAVIAQAATIEEAQRLYRAGDQDAAREELLEILALESEGVVRAQALDLLGMIAVDEGDLGLAADVWEKLISDYPDSPEAAEAKTKLSLASELDEEGALGAQTRSTRATTEPDKEASTSTPAPVERTTDGVESRPVVEIQPAEPEPAAAPEPLVGRSNLVLVAGRGKPHDGAQRAADLIMEHLQAKGVSAESATQGVPVVADATQAVTALVRQLEEEGGHSLILVTAVFENIGKVVVECYTPDGVVAWKKKVTGGTGWTGRPYSASGVNERLVERICEKLDKQVGDPCLPVSK